MKKFYILLFICLVSSGIFAQTATPPAAGDGSTGNPYQIATLDNLYWLSQSPSEWSKHYVQTANIDASATSSWDGGKGFEPIGQSLGVSVYFTGSYDGQGHIISNLTINRPSFTGVGLFGSARNSQFSNLGIVKCSITGNNSVGAIVGQINFNASSISQCFSTGNVFVNGVYAGGLVGSLSHGKLNNCYSFVSVQGSGATFLGGLVGVVLNSAELTNCYCIGSVSSGGYSGGLVGYSAGSANNCFWDKETSGKDNSALGTGKTTAEMKMQSTYTGWDFAGTWAMLDYFNDGYPYLQWQTVPIVNPMPLANWAIYIGIFLVLAFSAYRFRDII